MTSTEAPTYETAAQVCQRLHIGMSTLLRYVNAGKITRYKVGAAARYRTDEINAFMDARIDVQTGR